MLIVQYNKISPENRDVVRLFESKPFVGYIRYLLLKRWPFERVRKELMLLGLSWSDKEHFLIYFKEALYPALKKYRLHHYYKKYKYDLDDEPLTIKQAFGADEQDRITFIDFLKEAELEQFFAEEIMNYYGGPTSVPDHPETGQPLIPNEKPIDLVGLLNHPKKHIIEEMLVEGFPPKQIEEHLFQRFDIDIKTEEIKMYAKSFFNVKRHDVSKLIESLQEEQDAVKRKLVEIRQQPPDDISFGERYELAAGLSEQSEKLTKMIKKLSNVHSSTAFSAAVLETSDMRDMFKDVMTRAHRRFRDMDERTEDDVVNPLNTVVSMMSRATGRVLDIEDLLNQTVTKSINEEMLDVIMPTLDRIEEEEREAMYSYHDALDKEDEENDDDIIGFE